ncbi:DUF4097 domain-containing protein [Pseudoclavibacter chungangensis]|uniref:DUF4097 domain-containing protein n=1 Tax=Pseudoclavibacter chungangensis TaxID=587635 RepID=A0A7J5BS37_9MICO|nr:DUF4097 domain-containing protein [Pseudoclavibacter chungangensis]KAB1656809.1 DUF4097 domain-containing protein [Pseudoclavibacter chungangensis]NYJ67259.1 hypothetical protein [Pseudoclavibacter chungangensis]
MTTTEPRSGAAEAGTDAFEGAGGPPPTSKEGGPTLRRPHAWVAIVVAVVGALVLVGSFTTAIASSLSPVAYIHTDEDGFYIGPNGPAADNETSFVSTAPVDGVDAIRVEASAADVDVEYTDVDEATALIRGASAGGDWVLSSEGSTLVLSGPDDDIGFGGSWGISWIRLQLPRALEASTPDLTIAVGAGATDVTGTFGDVVIDVAAGEADFEGDANALTATIAAGRLEFDATVEGDVSLEVSSGQLTGTLRGDKQPTSISLEVQSGAATLAVPEGEYALSGSGVAGDRQIEVDTSSKATVPLEVTVESGAAHVGYNA